MSTLTSSNIINLVTHRHQRHLQKDEQQRTRFPSSKFINANYHDIIDLNFARTIENARDRWTMHAPGYEKVEEGQLQDRLEQMAPREVGTKIYVKSNNTLKQVSNMIS